MGGANILKWVEKIKNSVIDPPYNYRRESTWTTSVIIKIGKIFWAVSFMCVCVCGGAVIHTFHSHDLQSTRDAKNSSSSSKILFCRYVTGLWNIPFPKSKYNDMQQNHWPLSSSGPYVIFGMVKRYCGEVAKFDIKLI